MSMICDDPEERVSCWWCNASVPVEEAFSELEGDWVCAKCRAEWVEHFQSCDHAWEPYIEPNYGDEGQYCTRCGGFVRNEDMPHVMRSRTQ